MSTAVEKDAHLVRGRMWAADCGVEFRQNGNVAGMRWEYADRAFPCTVCGAEVKAGRLTVRNAHPACLPADAWWRHDSGKAWGAGWFEDDANAGGRWHKDTRRATKRKGDASTANPSATSAAKALAKVDPVTAPRFQVVAAESTHPVAVAARSWAMAAEVARSSAPAGPKSSTARRKDRPVKVVEVAPEADVVEAPVVEVEPVEVTYRTVEPLADDPVGERLERIARVVDHFPAVEVRPVAALPVCVEEWLGRLVFGPKADYARAYVAHLLSGAPAPEDPGAEWAEKARKRAARVVAQVTR